MQESLSVSKLPKMSSDQTAKPPALFYLRQYYFHNLQTNLVFGFLANTLAWELEQQCGFIRVLCLLVCKHNR